MGNGYGATTIDAAPMTLAITLPLKPAQSSRLTASLRLPSTQTITKPKSHHGIAALASPTSNAIPSPFSAALSTPISAALLPLSSTTPLAPPPYATGQCSFHLTKTQDYEHNSINLFAIIKRKYGAGNDTGDISLGNFLLTMTARESMTALATRSPASCPI